MNNENEVEKFYMIRATEFIDNLYDKGYFNKEVKREDMRKIDELLGFLFQANVNSALKANELLRQVNKEECTCKHWIDGSITDKCEKHKYST